MNNKIEKTLVERGNVYGNYMDTIIARTSIMKTLTDHHAKSNKGQTLLPKEIIMIGDLVLKLVRASASPRHSDTFHDISGYASLIEKEYCKNNEK